MKKVCNEKGSTLVWAMTIIMVLVIIVAAVLTLSKQYHSRTLYTARLKQAEMSAKSTGDMLVKAMNLPYDDDHNNFYFIPDAGKVTDSRVELTDFDLPEKMGDAKVFIERLDDNSVLLDIEVTYQKVSSELKVYVVRKMDEILGRRQWVLVEYDDDMEKRVK